MPSTSWPIGSSARLRNVSDLPHETRVTVDDTGARHAGKGCFSTYIGSDRFAAFRTGPGKSRLAFLSPLLGTACYVTNAARAGNLPHDVSDRLASQLLGAATAVSKLI